MTFVTAWCALVEYAQLKRGETVAIFGAAGGVGGAGGPDCEQPGSAGHRDQSYRLWFEPTARATC